LLLHQCKVAEQHTAIKIAINKWAIVIDVIGIVATINQSHKKDFVKIY
jgi:hypothetical protein